MSEYTRNVQALNEQQKSWFRTIDKYPVHILTGPAGVGKTYISVSEGCSRLDKGIVDKMVFLRPHVATEEIGFLPGDLHEKLDPFMRPLIDIALARLSAKRYQKYVAEDKIEIAALAYLRGRTFSNSWVILDEAQNCTKEQLKMVLTRLGENTTLIISGDLTQSDLGSDNGLKWVNEKFADCPVVGLTTFNSENVVRSKTLRILLQHLGE
jgi:phosphate starvation-inducible PhoH-like protein